MGTHGSLHKLTTQFSSEVIGQQMQEAFHFLTDLGVPVKGVSYPFGDFDDRVETEAKRVYTYSRTSLEGLNDAKSDRYRLRIFPVTKDITTEMVLSALKSAEATSTWIILLFHDLGLPDDSLIYRTDFNQYTTVLDDIKQRKLKVVTVGEGVSLLK